MAEDDELTEQDRVWELLHDRVSKVLRRFGTEDHFGKGDYLLVDDNYGWPLHMVECHKFHMLKPAVISALQSLLREFPGEASQPRRHPLRLLHDPRPITRQRRHDGEPAAAG